MNGPRRSRTSTRSHHTEFAPAIPWRVAPQQSPPPLRRMFEHMGSHDSGIALPRRLATAGAITCMLSANASIVRGRKKFKPGRKKSVYYWGPST